MRFVGIYFNGASSFALNYDLFFWSMVALCGLVTLAIALALAYFAVRYHRRNESALPPQIRSNVMLEAAWIAIPLLLFFGMFAYGTDLYFNMQMPPPNSTEVFVVAKQWMWKLQHTGGQREINELHVPVGIPVKLTMTSQDVIHSFFVPAFRIKQDILPNRYTTIWFEATKPGEYHLFCAEYCGAQHSAMKGTVHAMDRQDFDRWLIQGGAEGSLSSLGEKLFHQYACANCHHFDGHGEGPNLQRIYGRPVKLMNEDVVMADAGYLRESILTPRAKIVLGFNDIMPTFQGQLSEEQVIQLVSYIRAIGPVQAGPRPPEER